MCCLRLSALALVLAARVGPALTTLSAVSASIAGCGSSDSQADFLVVVESSLYDSLEASLEQYAESMRLAQFEVHVEAWPAGNVWELRALLWEYVDLYGIEGALLIGDLPAAWYEQMGPQGGWEQFPTDVFLQDRDAQWVDQDNNGLLDFHTELELDLYTSRLVGTPSEIEDYFARLDHYRNVGPLVDVSALVFLDDDWSGKNTEDVFGLSALYGTVEVIQDKAESTFARYLEELTVDGHEFVYQWIHGSPEWLQYEDVDRDGNAEFPKLYAHGVADYDLKVSFVSMADCYAARFTEQSVASAYAIGTQYGLATIGSTKAGAQTAPRFFHAKLAEGMRWGEAYLAWYNAEGKHNDLWNLGMALMGDPLLRVHGDLFPPVSEDAATVSFEEDPEQALPCCSPEAEPGTFEDYKNATRSSSMTERATEHCRESSQGSWTLPHRLLCSLSGCLLSLMLLFACAGDGGANVCDEVECDDDNECTEDRCDPDDPRVCLFVVLPADTPCHQGGVCNDSGSCKECNRDEQCEDDFNDCTIPRCDPEDGACEEAAPAADGTSCAGGICFEGACELTDSVLPCTEQGVRNATAAGGGPYTFNCHGPTTLTTAGEIVIGKDVVLDGEGNLTLDGNGDHGLFHIPEGVTAELHGFELIHGIHGIDWNFGTLTMTDSVVSGHSKAGIRNFAQMTLIDCTVTGNDSSEPGGGILSDGWLTLDGSTVSGNSAPSGGGIYVGSGTVTLVNSTVSGNSAELGGGGIHTKQALVLAHSTVAGNAALLGNAVLIDMDGSMTSANSLVEGSCRGEIGSMTSLGHNVESPGDTCGFGAASDQVDVSGEYLALGILADNGGPTQTHALRSGSVAIDQIPTAMCLDQDGQPLTFDQRGQPRPESGGSMCDTGAFERQPEDAM